MEAPTRPVPRPPARRIVPEEVQLATRIRKAQLRDDDLTPQEQLVKLLTRHELAPERYAHPDGKGKAQDRLLNGVEEKTGEPLTEEEVQAEAHKRAKAMKKRLQSLGWTVEGRYARHRIRIEGTHQNGAMVMLTVKMKKTSVESNLYALPGRDGIGWKGVTTANFTAFTANPNQKLKGRTLSTRCTCDKTGYPSKEAARKALLKLKLKKVRTGQVGIGGSIYRCMDDDRRWHYTRQPETYKPRPRGLWKEPGNEPGHETAPASTATATTGEPDRDQGSTGGEIARGQLADDRRQNPPEPGIRLQQVAPEGGDDEDTGKLPGPPGEGPGVPGTEGQ